MAKLIFPIALGLALGWAASHALFLGWWTLVPWGVAGLALGYWIGKQGALLAGGLYGFSLSFVFMLAGYSGSAPIVTRAPFFALLGVFGALCGLILAALGASIKTRANPTSPR
jgi:hypothetical protein